MNSKDDVLEFDTKISEDDMGGSSSNTGEFDLGTAVELLGLDDEDAKTQTSKLQGAYMSFLLLRHLRLRDLQRSVRNVWGKLKDWCNPSGGTNSMCSNRRIGM